jgi:hypothetical protein
MSLQGGKAKVKREKKDSFSAALSSIFNIIVVSAQNVNTYIFSCLLFQPPDVVDIGELVEIDLLKDNLIMKTFVDIDSNLQVLTSLGELNANF